MQSIFRRAWLDSLSAVGFRDFSFGKLLRSTIQIAVFIAAVFHIRGGEEAMIEAWDFFWVAVGTACAFAATFLWNLWLAPYRVMKDEIGQLKANTGGLKASLSATPVTARLNVKHWEGTKTFKLGDAACLWVEVRPHEPIEDDRAAGKFAQLRSALMRQEIPYNPGGIRSLANLLEGKRPWPEYSHPISAIALRRYADATNNVPTFLQSVEVPPEPDPEPEEKNDNEGEQ